MKNDGGHIRGSPDGGTLLGVVVAREGTIYMPAGVILLGHEITAEDLI